MLASMENLVSSAKLTLGVHANCTQEGGLDI